MTAALGYGGLVSVSGSERAGIGREWKRNPASIKKRNVFVDSDIPRMESKWEK